MPLIDDEQAIQTLTSNRTNPALSKGIRIRCPIRRVNHFNSRCIKNSIEGCRELGVPIMDKKTNGRCLLIQRPAQLAGLLSDPNRGRVTGTASQMDASAADFDEKEHVQCLQPKRFHTEEIAGEHLVLVLVEECPPVQASSAFWRSDNASLSQNILDGGSVQPIAQLLQFTLDLVVAPLVLLGQTND